MSEQIDPASSEKKHVTIAGNIGAGKTALTEVMGQYFDWTPMYEQVDDNPYLTDFYNDMRRWSFNLQVFFLSRRFSKRQEIEEMEESVVQDRSIYEDAEIFARNLHEMGLMSGRDFKNYSRLFSIMTSYLQPPDLLIYLRAEVPTLVRQIQQRGREYENTIRIEYLERLNRLYEDWIDRYDQQKLIIDTDNLDFVNDQNDLGKVMELIEQRLFGLFN